MSFLNTLTVSPTPLLFLSVACSKPAGDVDMEVEVIAKLSNFSFLLYINDYLTKKNVRGIVH